MHQAEADRQVTVRSRLDEGDLMGVPMDGQGGIQGRIGQEIGQSLANVAPPGRGREHGPGCQAPGHTGPPQAVRPDRNH